MKEQEYLQQYIFKGLENKNDGFDLEGIFYFTEADFEIVLDRAEAKGLSIYGIEPWLSGEHYDVKIFEHYKTEADDPSWYRKAFADFKNSGEPLLYAASFEVPKNLLEPAMAI